jgi:arginine/lysine/histidine/glutamine transport system substrate-binding/permease protein
MVQRVLFSLLFFLLISGCAEKPVDHTSTGERAVLRVACSGKYPPFSFYDAQGELTGFDVDVSKAIAEAMGRDVEVITTEWSGIIAGLQAGRYDAIIGSMGITPEREQMVLFSEPYYISGAQLFVRSVDQDRYRSIEDMKGKSIGAGIGSTYQLYVEKEFPEISVRSYPSEQAIFEDMGAGRLDGFVTDRLVGMFNAKSAGQDFVPVGDLLYDERVAIPVTFANADLLVEINAALVEIEVNGTMQALRDKYFALPQEPVVVPATVVLEKLGKGFLITIYASALAIGLGFLLAIPFGIGIKSAPQPFRTVLRLTNEFIRGTPFLVQLLFVYYALPKLVSQWTGLEGVAENFSPIQAGIVTLMINTSAYMAEVVRSGLIAVPAGQALAARALGMSKLQTFRYVIWPQAFRVMIPPLMNSVVASIKDTAMLSVISVAEVVTEAQKLISVTFDPMQYYLYVALLYFILSWPLMKAAQRLEENIRKKGYTENA